MKFTKVQGAGNDFVLVETDDMQRDWSPLSVAMCNRHFGVGADGLLLVMPSDVADFRMRVFNTDGSEADACGNGLRCLIRYVLQKGLVKRNTHQVLVETLTGVRKFELNKKGNGAANILVGMGVPKFNVEDIPVIIEDKGKVVYIKSMLNYTISIDGYDLPLNLVRVGNPHVVYFCQSPLADFPLAQLGPQVEKHKLFPKGTNFEIARPIDRQHIEARVWERGVGETLACGSGACAIATAARLHDYIDNKVDIILPGGVLQVEWDGVGELFLSGPAAITFDGEWPEEM